MQVWKADWEVAGRQRGAGVALRAMFCLFAAGQAAICIPVPPPPAPSFPPSPSAPARHAGSACWPPCPTTPQAGVSAVEAAP